MPLIPRYETGIAGEMAAPGAGFEEGAKVSNYIKIINKGKGEISHVKILLYFTLHYWRDLLCFRLKSEVKGES